MTATYVRSDASTIRNRKRYLPWTCTTPARTEEAAIAGTRTRGAPRRRLPVAAAAAARRIPAAVVGPLPLPVADVLRRALPRLPGSSLPAPVRRAALRGLCAAGIPRKVSTFGLVDHPDLQFVAVDSQVLAQLYWCGEEGWEPELLPWWRRFCRASESVLELGANVGYFSVQGGRAAPGTRHVAVEPHPFSARTCRDNLALNGVTSVEVLEAAAVADPGVSSLSLLVPAGQQATPTVAFLPAGTELPPDMTRDVVATIDVPAVDVRRLLDGVDLIKLDVEGQEHALLEACRDHLSDVRPALFVEVLPGTARLRTLLSDLCRQDGYRCYAMTRDRLVELTPDRLATVRLREAFGCQDVVLTARPVPPP